MEKPAGMTPPANHQENEMSSHLILLLLIVVVLGIEVKIIINRR